MSNLMPVILMLVAAVPLAAAPVLSLQPAALSVSAGQSFSLDIVISGITDLYAYEFELGFNPLVLSAATITEGGFLPGGGVTWFSPGTIDNAAGTISLTGAFLLGAVPGVGGDGVLTTIGFSAVGAGNSPVNLFNTLLLDSTLSGITAISQSATVDVTGRVVPEPGSALLLGVGLLLLKTVRRAPRGRRET